MFNAHLHDMPAQYKLAHNEEVEAFLNAAHLMLKSKGYAYKATRASALYERAYTCPTSGRRIVIDGWHGTGTRGTNRFWGDVKSLHCLYDSAAPGYKPVVEAVTLGDDMAKLIADQSRAQAAALKYIREKA